MSSTATLCPSIVCTLNEGNNYSAQVRVNDPNIIGAKYCRFLASVCCLCETDLVPYSFTLHSDNTKSLHQHIYAGLNASWYPLQATGTINNFWLRLSPAYVPTDATINISICVQFTKTMPRDFIQTFV